MSEQAGGFEGERRRAVTCDRHTPFADVTSVLSQVRCFAYATQLSQRLTRRRSQESTVILPDTLSVMHDSHQMDLYTVGRTHFPSTKVSVQSWYASRRTMCSMEVEQQTRSHRAVPSQGRLLQPSHISTEAKEVYDTSFQSISTSFVLSRDRRLRGGHEYSQRHFQYRYSLQDLQSPESLVTTLQADTATGADSKDPARLASP